MFKEIFYIILKQDIDYDFVDICTIFGGGTHQKMNVNTKKSKNIEVEITKKYYEDQLLKEINENREYTYHK